MPQFSLVAGYRNRDLLRVKRFLDSLQNQTFRDFELVFVDYGSDPDIRTKVSQVCGSYGFCRYFFCDTSGRVWNRAHALNIGIQHAKGKYFVSADVDLIYSKDVLSALISVCHEQVQVFCKALLLPSSFSDYSHLSQLPAEFPLTKDATLGLFHCVHMDWVKKIRGYDEHYRIWGFEDNDFARRLEQLGLTSLWLNVQATPIYHQWHPAGNKHAFMPWWWVDMAVYSTTNIHQDKQHWGELFTSETRPLNHVDEAIGYVCPAGMDPFACRKAIAHIMDLLRSNPDKQILVELLKEPDRMYVQQNFSARAIARLAGATNRCLRFFGSTIQLRASDSQLHRSEAFMLYFFYDLIMKSDQLMDYRFDEEEDKYRLTLLPKHESL